MITLRIIICVRTTTKLMKMIVKKWTKLTNPSLNLPALGQRGLGAGWKWTQLIHELLIQEGDLFVAAASPHLPDIQVNLAPGLLGKSLHGA